MIPLFLSLLVSVAGARTTAPAIHSGLVEVRPGHRLFVNYQPAANGKPTLFMLNGLTYSTKEWKSFVTALHGVDPDYGIVLYDMEGMGETLLNKLPVVYDIPIENQVEDLRDLVTALNIHGPISALGLSYGGAVGLKFAAQYPHVFEQMIAAAPFLERMPEQDLLIIRSVRAHRFMWPFDRRSDEELYDLYLRAMVATYPLSEPIILRNPFALEGVYRMVKGAKNWLASSVAKLLPRGKVHIVASRADEYVAFDRMQFFVSKIPKNTLASYMVIQDPPLQTLLPTQKFHKIPELRPRLAAAWVHEILSGNAELQKGLTFWADPVKGEARSGKIVIPLEKSNGCETSLRKVSGTR